MRIFKKKTSSQYTVMRNGYKGLQIEKRKARVVKHTGNF